MAVRVTRIITRLNIGGPAIQAINLSGDLAPAGFDTSLIHGRPGEREGSMTDLLPIRAADVVYLDALQRSISPLSDLRALWKLFEAMRRWQPDIVHTHMAKAGTLGRLAAIAYNWTAPKDRRARLVHTYHGHVFEGYFGKFRTRFFLFVERFLARRTHALIAISPGVEEDLRRTYRIGNEQQLRLIPLGFDLSRLSVLTPTDRTSARRSLQIEPGAVVVTTVGRLTAIKQQELFLAMAERLLKRDERFLFLIAGDGELRQSLEARAQELGIARRTRFLGWQRDLATLYATTDVFVLTSRNEGTPVALIEAMAAGVACVSTDVGGVRDVIGAPELGVVVPFGDPDALASAVVGLADEPGRRYEVGTRAREYVTNRFCRQRLVEDVKQLYLQLLGSRDRGVRR